MSENRLFDTLVLGSSTNSFINLFELRWKEHLSSFPQKYRQAKQLQIGSRFRPLLVAWGHLLSGGDFGSARRLEVANLAVYVELLHKATLLIDDFIDGDNARHGRPAFHAEFGDHEAVLFAIYLLGDCLDELSASTRCFHREKLYPDIVDLLSRAIKDMALGGLEEINLDRDEFGSISKIEKIMELQTAALVKNGLLVGYKYGRGDPAGDRAIDSLGYDSSYLFQALNDLEPFLGARRNSDYKGAANTDVSRFRKNLAVANLLNKLSARDRKEFHGLRTNSASLLGAKLEEWLHEYRVIEHMAENLGLVKQNIDRTINTLPVDEDRRGGFASFIDYVLSKALSRLDAAPRQKLSESPSGKFMKDSNIW